MKIVNTKEQTAPALPSAQFKTEIEDPKKEIQNTCFIVRNLCQSAQYMEPKLANELMATALLYLDASLKLLEEQEPDGINIASCYDVLTAALMVPSVATQSKFQNQYVSFYEKEQTIYAAQIAFRAKAVIEATKEVQLAI